MKAIVTGGAGFIGSHIAERLVKDGHEVIVIDDLSAGKIDNIPPGVKFIERDISKIGMSGRLHKAFTGCDVIFHNAASKKNISEASPSRDLRVNAGGVLNLLRYAQQYKVSKFVHASTGSVYGEADGIITEDTLTRPVSYYGVSKLAGENYVRLFSNRFNISILRYFHVYGPKQETDPNLGGVVSIMSKQIANDKTITIHGSGEQERVFTYVDDIVNANITVWKSEKARGQIYNCASSKVTTIKQLAESLGAKKINHGDPLPGDIFKFNVDASKIEKLGVTFRDYE